eukprot:765274-Hanusia_phi.AAC.1
MDVSTRQGLTKASGANLSSLHPRPEGPGVLGVHLLPIAQVLSGCTDAVREEGVQAILRLLVHVLDGLAHRPQACKVAVVPLEVRFFHKPIRQQMRRRIQAQEIPLDARIP